MAAELSDHSDNRGLVGYCTWLSNTRPELYVSMLGRLLPIQAKVETNNGVPQRLSTDMPLEEMVKNLEWKFQSGYRPPVIEHEADDDE